MSGGGGKSGGVTGEKSAKPVTAVCDSVWCVTQSLYEKNNKCAGGWVGSG